MPCSSNKTKCFVWAGHRKIHVHGIFVDEMGLTDEPELVIMMKTKIQEYVETYLNVDEHFSHQDPSDIVEIEEKLIQTFPDIFKDRDIPKPQRRRRMARAMEYVRRHLQRLRDEHKSSYENDSNDDDNTDSAPGSGNKYEVRPPQQIASLARSSLGESANTIRILEAPSQHVVTKHGSAQTLTPQSMPSLLNVVASPSSPYPSQIDNDYQPDEVRAFLQSCEPPMGHLLQTFLAFGCRNRLFLEAVAESDQEEIEGFIRKVLEQSASCRESSSVPEIELECRLEVTRMKRIINYLNHLTYFNTIDTP
ncbi:hypothetical protein NP233_g5850 [Leucocoprinus birnbaumii]|uniref:Uncharacterized protein n=1 Tax=Leucocoprinus birnbaumii TaxID=56174 RepID=A0AAD5YRH5_9AGAR|nr:hypothetical protein NP233_g5850 [Leucocoprinus birnbaumii]